MSEQNDWAPEPWEFKPENWLEGGDQNENEIIAADGTCVTSDMQFYPHIHTESMERIAACVSACAGVPTRALLMEAKGTETVACSCGYLHRFMKQSKHISHIRFHCRWCGEVTGVDIVQEAPDDSGRTPAGD